MQQTPWKADRHSATQEILQLSYNPEVYHFHKNLPLVPALSQINPFHILLSHASNIHFNIILGFPTRIFYTLLISYMCATCLANLVLLHLINLLVSDTEYKLCIFPLHNFLQLYVMSSLSGLNILFGTLFINTFNPCSSPDVRPSFTPTKEKWCNYSFVHFNLVWF
jgi:hypothetical protein